VGAKPQEILVSKWTEVLLAEASEYWGEIQRATSKSIKAKAKGFLPEPSEENILGCGYWGCVLPTADKRFVLKLTLDSTEGPHVAMAMDRFPLHPGIAYFHRIWKLPGRVWAGSDGGNVWLYVILREEVNVDSIWSVKKKGRKQVYVPARGFKKIHDALEELPVCCSCLSESRGMRRRGLCSRDRVAENEGDLVKLLKRVGLTDRKSKGYHVANLLAHAYEEHGVLLGDVHFGNVGLRRHSLKPWGVKGHRALVVTDLGDLGQAPMTTDQYPRIATVNPNMLKRYENAIPVLP
jgi:hypothetical protein